MKLFIEKAGPYNVFFASLFSTKDLKNKGLTIKLIAAVMLAFLLYSCDSDVSLENEPTASSIASVTKLSPLLRQPSTGDTMGFQTEQGAYAWLGLPFAQPPVGDLRWRAPRAISQWDIPQLSDKFGSPCVQLPIQLEALGDKSNEHYGDEDCLYLNIYAPPMSRETAKDSKLPVMFWIHGGGNSIGEASQFDGSGLANRQNVVVVTINYRLGPLGWFRQQGITGSGNTEADRSGNFGTLDQILALEWVRDNISAFGGEEGNVTIFGESAGGRNVVALLLSPLAKGLFHRAIVQSGNSYFPELGSAEFFHPNSGSNSVKKMFVAKAINNVEEMRDVNAHEILELYRVPNSELPLLDVPNVFRDGYVIPKNAGLQAFREGQYNQVPTMLGTNRDEQKLFMYLKPDNTRKWLGFWQTLRDSNSYERDAYYMSTRWRIAGAEAPARVMSQPVYVYRFDWDEQATPLGMDFPAMIGAAHGLEISFILGAIDMGAFDQVLITEDNQAGRDELSETMMNYWGNFARNGNPNGESSSAVKWLPWGEQEQFIILDTQSDKGVFMSRDTHTYEQLMVELKNDLRFHSSADRCRLFLDLLEWSPELLAWKKYVGC